MVINISSVLIFTVIVIWCVQDFTLMHVSCCQFDIFVVTSMHLRELNLKKQAHA